MSDNLFSQGIEQFNRREFYPCHDTLEAIWMDSIEPDKTFYQGILQIAVGCYHILLIFSPLLLIKLLLLSNYCY